MEPNDTILSAKFNKYEFSYRGVIITVYPTSDNNNIDRILYEYDDEKLELGLNWEEFSNYVLSPRKSLAKSILFYLDGLSKDDYNSLSTTDNSLLSIGDPPFEENNFDRNNSDKLMLKNFARGLSAILMLEKYKYIRLSSLGEGYNVLSGSNLDIIRMFAVAHLKCTTEDERIVKHALDFTSRWSLFFHKGDVIEKSEYLLELMINYLLVQPTDRENQENRDKKKLRKIEETLSRLEARLGILERRLDVQDVEKVEKEKKKKFSPVSDWSDLSSSNISAATVSISTATTASRSTITTGINSEQVVKDKGKSAVVKEKNSIYKKNDKKENGYEEEDIRSVWMD